LTQTTSPSCLSWNTSTQERYLSSSLTLHPPQAPSLLKSYLGKISDAEAMNETVSFFAESQQCGEEDEDLDEDGVPLTLLRLLNLLDMADEYLCGPSQGHLKELCEVVLSKMVRLPHLLPCSLLISSLSLSPSSPDHTSVCRVLVVESRAE
jgi:hypothetical protein